MSAAPSPPEIPAPADAAIPSGVDPSSYRIPSLGGRVLRGGLRLVGVVVFLTGLPAGLVSFLNAQGIQPPIAFGIIEVFGALIAVLVALRYILKPTVAYGPLAIATAGATLVYLYLIFVTASYAITIPHADVTIAVDYSRLILLLTIGPALAATAGVLTLFEDVSHPKERLPFDYPA